MVSPQSPLARLCLCFDPPSTIRLREGVPALSGEYVLAVLELNDVHERVFGVGTYDGSLERLARVVVKTNLDLSAQVVTLSWERIERYAGYFTQHSSLHP